MLYMPAGTPENSATPFASVKRFSITLSPSFNWTSTSATGRFSRSLEVTRMVGAPKELAMSCVRRNRSVPTIKLKWLLRRFTIGRVIPNSEETDDCVFDFAKDTSQPSHKTRSQFEVALSLY